MFTRRHFVQIAEALAKIKNVDNRRQAAAAMAAIFTGSNPRFDAGRFLAACGLKLSIDLKHNAIPGKG